MAEKPIPADGATATAAASAADMAPDASTTAADSGKDQSVPVAAKSAATSNSKDSDSEEEDSPEQKRVLAALEKVLDDWLMTGLPRAAAKKFIREKVANGDDTSVVHVRRWFLLRMNGRMWDHGVHLMCRTPENIPGLRALPVWPREQMSWLQRVEERHAEILEELLRVREACAAGQRSGFQPYRDPVSSSTQSRVASDGVGVEGVDSGAWNVLYLYLNHKRFEENCERFPVTLKAIEEAFPRQYSHAFFSALTPGSHIMKHHGPSNRMLRVWLPMCGLKGFRLRVSDTIVEPKDGEAFAWDHSFEHEAWHEGNETRIVLIVDIWHPDLSNAEVQLLKTMQNCRLRAGRVLAEHAQEIQAEQAAAAGVEVREQQDSNYFDLIERARHLLTDDDWWVVNAERDPTTKPT